MEENNTPKEYSKHEKKMIRLNWLGLFVVFFAVLAFSAMKPIIAISKLWGYVVCFCLAGLISYFMSFTMYEYSKQKGIWVYGIVVVVILLMLMRYKF